MKSNIQRIDKINKMIKKHDKIQRLSDHVKENSNTYHNVGDPPRHLISTKVSLDLNAQIQESQKTPNECKMRKSAHAHNM